MHTLGCVVFRHTLPRDAGDAEHQTTAALPEDVELRMLEPLVHAHLELDFDWSVRVDAIGDEYNQRARALRASGERLAGMTETLLHIDDQSGRFVVLRSNAGQKDTDTAPVLDPRLVLPVDVFDTRRIVTSARAAGASAAPVAHGSDGASVGATTATATADGGSSGGESGAGAGAGAGGGGPGFIDVESYSRDGPVIIPRDDTGGRSRGGSHRGGSNRSKNSASSQSRRSTARDADGGSSDKRHAASAAHGDARGTRGKRAVGTLISLPICVSFIVDLCTTVSFVQLWGFFHEPCRHRLHTRHIMAAVSI